MKDKYQNQYRTTTVRAQWCDYGWNSAYFITICTADRAHYFGEIVNGKMVLSNTGVIADILWYEIPNHTQFVALGDFVVMPNHIHGMLILDKPDGNRFEVEAVAALHATQPPPPHATPPPLSPPPLQSPLTDQLQPTKNAQMAAISPKSNSISTIIRSYKSAVTKHANRLGLKNGWQSRFHEHIIRNREEYERISNYIITNSENWDKNEFSEYT